MIEIHVARPEDYAAIGELTIECWLCCKSIERGDRTAMLAGQLAVHRRCLYADVYGTLGYERAAASEDNRLASRAA